MPAQIIAADLNGNGLTDLVVRNAGDGTLSVLFGTEFVGPINPNSYPAILASRDDSRGLGVWTSRRSIRPAAAGSIWWSRTR